MVVCSRSINFLEMTLLKAKVRMGRSKVWTSSAMVDPAAG